MTVTISGKVSDLKNQSTEIEKIYKFLSKQNGKWFTREGLMIKVFRVNPKALNIPSGKWSKADNNLYFRIVNALGRLIKQEKIQANTKKSPYKYWFKK